MKKTEKVKSKVIERLMKRLEEKKNDPIKKRDTPSKDWQIGFLTGEFIISNYLTSIKGIGIEFNKSIAISDDEYAVHKELQDKWLSLYREDKDTPESKDAWVKHREFEILLEERHLPKVLECYVPLIVVDNIKELKSGIRTSLWDCDGCTYEIMNDEDIVIEPSNVMSDTWTMVKLRLDVEKARKDLYEKNQ